MLSLPSLDHVTYAYDGSLRVDEGDLVFHDTDDAKPASSVTAGIDEAADQATFAPKFAGIAKERKLSADQAGNLDVIPDAVVKMPCVSATFEVGDFVAATRDGGAALVRRKVKKTTTAAHRIGYVVKREASAVTEVWVRLLSNVTPNRNLLA